MNILDAGTLGSIAAIVRGTGFRATFTHTVPGAHDPLTETFGAPVTTTIAGSALDVTQLPEEYQTGELVAQGSVKLFFWPDTEGAVPAKGARCDYAGGMTVDSALPVRPGGTAFAGLVVLV